MKDKAYKIGTFFTFLIILSGCSGDRLLESKFTADPSLLNRPSPTVSPTTSSAPLITLPTTQPTSSPEKPVAVVQSYIDDLKGLGIIEPGIDPNAPITRREYLRWLVRANNRFYNNQPSLQIRSATADGIPLFKDIPNNDPDYPIIQGLAEAGLLPSSLTRDNSALLLQPDLPLTRETMILWKVPLDYRKPFPLASLDTIKSSWGFSDANLIDPKVWRPLYVDFQNGDASNLRRAFGYTVLLQPKKIVTHAQAAAAIWSFGFQDGVLNASDILKRESLPTPTLTPNVFKSSPQ
jgi:hypothetical protein